MQGLNLGRAERAVQPRRKFPQAQRAHADPLQSLHLVPDPGQQAANLAVLPLGQHNFQQRAVPLGFDERRRLGGEPSFREVHPLLQLIDNLARGDPRDLHAVDLFDLEAGVGQAMGQLPVVGDQQQPFAVLIQSPDGEQPLGRLGEQVDHPGTSLGIAVGAEHPGRLVDEVVRPAVNVEPFAIEADILHVGIDAGPQFGDGLTIDGHAARGDVLFATAAGADAGHRQQPLQPHARGGILTVAHLLIVAVFWRKEQARGRWKQTSRQPSRPTSRRGSPGPSCESRFRFAPASPQAHPGLIPADESTHAAG